MTGKRAALPLVSRRILVVDDQPTIRTVLWAALSEAGAEVETAADGQDALLALEREVPHLLVLDLRMPLLDGWQVIERLRASPRTANLPVVLQTSAEDYASFDRAKKQGVAAFLSKPCHLNDLVETCRRVLEGARPLQGKQVADNEVTKVHVRGADGALIARGQLLDLSNDGAQVGLELPLPLGRRFTFDVDPDETAGARIQAEVRWVSSTVGGFIHGLLISRG